MENRLEVLRKEIDNRIMNGPQDKICLLSAHIYGVSKFCNLLALRRNLNPELAATCGMLHDVYYMTDITGNNHAENGSKLAREILTEMGSYTKEEIDIVCTAIKNHSNKRFVEGIYDELLKDADVLDHCFYNNAFPIADWEIERYNNLLKELSIQKAAENDTGNT